CGACRYRPLLLATQLGRSRLWPDSTDAEAAPFLVTADERREPTRVHRIKATDTHNLPGNAINLDGSTNSLDGKPTKRLTLKVTPDKPSCAGSNQDFSGLCHGL